MIEVFSTARGVRSFYEKQIDSNALLPKAITISELEQKAVYVRGKSLADEDTRVLLMKKASEFSSFDVLNIEREFLVFLKNSSYLFKFFEELSQEKVSIESLFLADTYAEYEEHLQILKLLLSRYVALLEEQNLYDKITLPQIYTLNKDYLVSIQGARIHLDSFLSCYEIELLKGICEVIPLFATVEINKYNIKTVELLSAFNLFLQENYIYELDLSKGEILSKSPISRFEKKADVYGFSSRILQAGFVFWQIEKCIEEGIEPENIVVVLPDESFASVLKLFDRWRNLNFAMGESLIQSQFYKRLSALELSLKHPEQQHILRLCRLGVGEEIVFQAKQMYGKKVSFEEVLAFFHTLLLLDEKEAKEPLFKDTLFRFEAFLKRLEPLRFEQILKLLLNRLAQQSKDDVGGGKITVMGVLETRGVCFEAVIVPDFNDEFIPKRSQKDLFLSTHVRAKSNLPTATDRENLQRYYYHKLFSSAKKIAISYVDNETSVASRFLDELDIAMQHSIDEKLFYSLLFRDASKLQRFDEEITGEYHLKSAKLSSSKLKTLLTCKRKFYFRYLLHLKEHTMPDTPISEKDVGLRLHSVLCDVVGKMESFDENRFLSECFQALNETNSSEIWAFHVFLWMERLKAFATNEAEKRAQGYRPKFLEQYFETSYKGFTLEGKIDRVDEFDGGLYVVDYKSGKVPTIEIKDPSKVVDFQLVFYYLLAREKGDVRGLYYYDLQEGVAVEEFLLDEKLALLDEVLAEYSKPITTFEKCEKTDACRYCPYVLLCGREECV
ncbi:MAG: PD-(D/E)XK nuclease family protein [Sulfurospirillaceae bacterium]|nr:PD-(D/E)XK nuclease family protein [Sulfurospirillaceae bacterium]